nr:MAG TPA_asm: hypothetical protein [Bacteriophage sp.]
MSLILNLICLISSLRRICLLVAKQECEVGEIVHVSPNSYFSNISLNSSS